MLLSKQEVLKRIYSGEADVTELGENNLLKFMDPDIIFTILAFDDRYYVDSLKEYLKDYPEKKISKLSQALKNEIEPYYHGQLLANIQKIVTQDEKNGDLLAAMLNANLFTSYEDMNKFGFTDDAYIDQGKNIIDRFPISSDPMKILKNRELVNYYFDKKPEYIPLLTMTPSDMENYHIKHNQLWRRDPTILSDMIDKKVKLSYLVDKDAYVTHRFLFHVAAFTKENIEKIIDTYPLEEIDALIQNGVIQMDKISEKQAGKLLSNYGYIVPSYSKNPSFISKYLDSPILVEHINSTILNDKELIRQALRTIGDVKGYMQNPIFNAKIKNMNKSFYSDPDIMVELSIFHYDIKHDSGNIKNERVDYLHLVDKKLWKNDDFVKEIIRFNPRSIVYAPVKFHTNENLLAALKYDSRIIGMLHKNKLNDKEFMIDAVKLEPSLLRRSRSMSKDYDVVLSAASVDLEALKYANPKLLKDKDFMQSLIDINPKAINYAHPSLVSNNLLDTNRSVKKQEVVQEEEILEEEIATFVDIDEDIAQYEEEIPTFENIDEVEKNESEVIQKVESNSTKRKSRKADGIYDDLNKEAKEMYDKLIKKTYTKILDNLTPEELAYCHKVFKEEYDQLFSKYKGKEGEMTPEQVTAIAIYKKVNNRVKKVNVSNVDTSRVSKEVVKKLK